MELYYIMRDNKKKAKYNFPFLYVLAVERDLTQMNTVKLMKKQEKHLELSFFENVHLPLG